MVIQKTILRRSCRHTNTMSNRQEAAGDTDPSPTSTHFTCTSISTSSSEHVTAESDGPPGHDEDENAERNRGSPPKESLCSRTSFFVNVDWRLGATLSTATTIVGQMYTERLDPVIKLHRYPIVLIHGDFHTGQASFSHFHGLLFFSLQSSTSIFHPFLFNFHKP